MSSALLPLLAALFAGVTSAGELCSIQFDNGASLILPVARSAEDQRVGLMGRTDPGPGLIFVWPAPVLKAVWMKDTPSPLTAAFVAGDGRIQSVQDMQPDSLTAHSSLRPVIGVIEVPQGELAKLGIGRDTYVVSAPCLPLSTREVP